MIWQRASPSIVNGNCPDFVGSKAVVGSLHTSVPRPGRISRAYHSCTQTRDDSHLPLGLKRAFALIMCFSKDFAVSSGRSQRPFSSTASPTHSPSLSRSVWTALRLRRADEAVLSNKSTAAPAKVKVCYPSPSTRPYPSCWEPIAKTLTSARGGRFGRSKTRQGIVTAYQEQGNLGGRSRDLPCNYDQEHIRTRKRGLRFHAKALRYMQQGEAEICSSSSLKSSSDWLMSSPRLFLMNALGPWIFP